MKRPTTWQEALRLVHPIVTDCALDSLEAEAIQRWQRTGCKDQFFADIISALRSQRNTIGRLEAKWAAVCDEHAAVLYTELAARDEAIRSLITEPASEAAA